MTRLTPTSIQSLWTWANDTIARMVDQTLARVVRPTPPSARPTFFQPKLEALS